MELWVFPFDCFMIDAHNSLSMEVGKKNWIPWWVELLVSKARLEKFFGALKGCGLS